MCTYVAFMQFFVKKSFWNVKCFRMQSFIKVESNIYILISHNPKRTTPHNLIQSLEKKRQFCINMCRSLIENH